MMFGTEHPLILMVMKNIYHHNLNTHHHLCGCLVLIKDIDGSYYYARVNAVNVSDNPVDVSHGYEYYFDVNETHTMLNWVYEEHYNKATVKCTGYSVDDYHGAWFGVTGIQIFKIINIEI